MSEGQTFLSALNLMKDPFSRILLDFQIFMSKVAFAFMLDNVIIRYNVLHRQFDVSLADSDN